MKSSTFGFYRVKLELLSQFCSAVVFFILTMKCKLFLLESNSNSTRHLFSKACIIEPFIFSKQNTYLNLFHGSPNVFPWQLIGEVLIQWGCRRWLWKKSIWITCTQQKTNWLQNKADRISSQFRFSKGGYSDSEIGKNRRVYHSQFLSWKHGQWKVMNVTNLQVKSHWRRLFLWRCFACMKPKARLVFFPVNVIWIIVEKRVQCSQVQGTQPQHGAGFSSANLTLCVHSITALNEGANKRCFRPVQKQDRSNPGE